MRDDLALLRAAHADYYLVPATANAAVERYSHEVDTAGSNDAAHLPGLRIALPESSIEIPEKGLTIGRDPSCDVVLDTPNVRAPGLPWPSSLHATVFLVRVVTRLVQAVTLLTACRILLSHHAQALLAHELTLLFMRAIYLYAPPTLL